MRHQSSRAAVCILLLSSIAAMPSTAWAKKKMRPVNPEHLVELWLEENNVCRGTLDPDRRGASCEVREAYGKRLEANGWCYGEEGQIGSQMVWHQCGGMGDTPVVLACSGKTLSFEGGVVKWSRKWDNEVLTIDKVQLSVRHNNEPEGPTLTGVTDTYYSWHQDSTLITDGSFNRIAGTGEERMTTQDPSIVFFNYYESCTIAPAPRF
jgi:hypothetical protein